MSELVLGTVQFGLNYGITNESGEVSDRTMKQMLQLANYFGIELFDTAADYGNSQERLGSFSEVDSKRRYVTKFSLCTSGVRPTVENIYLDSMNQLNVETLHGVLFHKIEDFRDPRCSEAIEILRNARESRTIQRVGVSVYNQRDLELALSLFPDLDILQIPANILDYSLLESALVQSLKKNGVEVHVRSVFLQGLLLSSPDTLPLYFSELKPILNRLADIATEHQKSVLELLLGKMRGHSSIDAILVGATTAEELEEIGSAWLSSMNIPDFELPPVRAELLDPRKWPKVRINT